MNAGRTRNPEFPSGSGEEGYAAIVVALLVMALLALLGSAFLTMSSTESTIALNDVRMVRAFNIAEAGLERGKNRIKTGTEANLDAFLAGTSPGPYPFGSSAGAGNSLDDGNYIVRIYDNNDELLIQDLNDDKDDRVFIESTGSLTNSPGRKQVLALVRVIKAPPMPAPRGAAETLAAPGASSEIHGEPGTFDGRDWTPPADIGACTDSASCGTKVSDTGTYGAFSNLAAISYALANGGTMYGTGCLSGACGTAVATSSHETDPSASTLRWDPYIDAMKLRANQTLPSSDLTKNTSYTWGTPANPQITVINVAGDFDWKAPVTGAGILILEGSPSQRSTFSGSGELHWQGLVLIRSAGRFEFEVAKEDALRVFGVMVNRSLTQSEIELKQDSFIKYSSAAVNMVNQNLGETFQVLNWREVALQ